MTVERPGKRIIRYDYANGLPASVTIHPGHKTSWSRDTKGRIKRQDIHTSAGARTFTLGQHYDKAGNLYALSYPGST